MTIEGWFRYDGSTDGCFKPIFESSSGDFMIGKDCGSANEDSGGILVIDGNLTSNGNWSSDYFDANNPNSSPHNAWDGNWHHIAYVFSDLDNGGNGKLFLDGRLLIDNYFNRSDSFETIYIANSYTYTNIDSEDLYRYFFDGEIDNAIITKCCKIY